MNTSAIPTVKNPIAGLLDKAYLAKLRATIDPERATPSSQVKPGQPAGTEDRNHALLGG